MDKEGVLYWYKTNPHDRQSCIYAYTDKKGPGSTGRVPKTEGRKRGHVTHRRIGCLLYFPLRPWITVVPGE